VIVKIWQAFFGKNSDLFPDQDLRTVTAHY